MSFQRAAECGTRVIMANGWHIFREAGRERLEQAGGIHGLIGWDGAVFTDSGGYQVFSLNQFSRVSDEGVTFSTHDEPLTPERIIDAQTRLGSDVIFVLDDCPPFPAEKKRVETAVRRTSLWASRSMAAFRDTPSSFDHRQQIYGIVQGGTNAKLRKRSIEEVAQLEFGGFGIGGLSIGMPRSATRDMTELCCERLPPDKPRHLLGVGLPNQILEGISDGADTFDCVLPIRKGQRGIAHTRQGEVKYKHAQPETRKDRPLDDACDCPTCNAYTREELRRLYKESPLKAGELASIHNIYFYHQLLAEARQAIREDRFLAFSKSFCEAWNEHGR